MDPNDRRLLKIQSLPVSEVKDSQQKRRKCDHLVAYLEKTCKRIQVHAEMHTKTSCNFLLTHKTYLPVLSNWLLQTSPQVCVLTLLLLLRRYIGPHDQVCTFRWNDHFRKLVLASTTNCSTQKAKKCQDFEASTGYRNPVSIAMSTLEMFKFSLIQMNWT